MEIEHLALVGLAVSIYSRERPAIVFMLSCLCCSLLSATISDASYWLYYLLCIGFDWLTLEFVMLIKCRLSNFIALSCIISAVINVYGLALWWSHLSPINYNHLQDQLLLAVIMMIIGDRGGRILQRIIGLLNSGVRHCANVVLYLGKVSC